MAAGFDLPRLFNTLTQLFRARPSPSLVPSLSDIVVPVYETHRVLHDIVVAVFYLNVSAGQAIIYTVPAGKRAEVHNVYRQATVGLTSILQSRAGTNVRMVASTTSSTGYIVRWPMDPLDQIRLEQGAAGDTSIECSILYREWDYRP